MDDLKNTPNSPIQNLVDSLPFSGDDEDQGTYAN